MASTKLFYHGTERGGFEKPRAGSFFTASRAEAIAYTEITDVDSDRSLRYVTEAETPRPIVVPERVNWADSWPDYFDYTGPAYVLAANGNTNRLFYWDGTTNPVGDRNICILSGIVAADDGAVVRRPTVDDEACTPRVLRRQLYIAQLDIRNPLRLPWDEANVLGRRLGADPASVQARIDAWRAQGYDGIETESDDALLFAGRHIRQLIPFDTAQIHIVSVEDLDAPHANPTPLPAPTTAARRGHER